MIFEKTDPAATIGQEFVIRVQQVQRREKLLQIMPIVVLAVLFIFFSIACPGSFLTFYNSCHF